jgi:hypothetical protein
MSQPPPADVTTRRDVYLLCPDLASFRATHPRPLRGVWRTVNNDFGSYKRKQRQQQRKKRKGAALEEVAVSDEDAYEHTRQRALRTHEVVALAVSSPASTPTIQVAVPASAGVPSHSSIREAFGDECFPWAYWASQDSLAEHRLTGYYLTDQQWLNRVMKLIETLGDPRHADSWHHRALDHRPFDDRAIMEAGRSAAIPSRPDAVELIQRQVTAQVASTLEQLQRAIHEKLEVMQAGLHPPSSAQAAHPKRAPSPSSSQPSASAITVSSVEDEAVMVDYEGGALVLDCVTSLPTTTQERPSAEEQHQQPPPTSWSSSSHSAHPRRGAIESIFRIPFDNVEFVNPRHRSRRWRLTYRGKGTFAQVYVGKSQHDLDPAHVAIKFALNPSTQIIDRELMHEAEMMDRVARVSPHAVCRLVFQPRPNDDVVTMSSGARQPVFIAMELVDSDFGELERSGHLSRCALCEGFLLSFLALRDVHRSGVLHRDLKLNNLAFSIHDSADPTTTPVRSDTCSQDGRLSARILDFGEAVYLRPGDRGPTDYGQCRAEYASIARHNHQEQGFKDDIEMLLYAFLDKLLTGGLPWKRQPLKDSGKRLDRSEMQQMKVSFRQHQGEQSEMHLIHALSALDAIKAGVEPPYRAVEDALTRAWEHEWREHHSRKTSSSRRMYDCLKLLRRRCDSVPNTGR